MLNNVLFEEYKYFNYKFPEPQYLGAKINFIPWIAQFLPNNVNTALDAIPNWILSYNNRSYPSIETMVDLIKPFRNVRVEYKTYSNSRGGKGSVAGSSEILLICTK